MNQPNPNPNNQKPQMKKQPQTNKKNPLETTKKKFSVHKADCRHRMPPVLFALVPMGLYWQGASRWNISSKRFGTAWQFKPMGYRLHNKRYGWKKLLNIFYNCKLKIRPTGGSGCSLEVPYVGFRTWRHLFPFLSFLSLLDPSWYLWQCQSWRASLLIIGSRES